MKKKKIIYILSSSHSGSTLLDILLSKHQEVVGLGEIYSPLIGKKKNLEETGDVCSCGDNFINCPIWSKYNDAVKDLDEEDYFGKYEEVLDIIDHYGKDVLIDSSKKVWLLEILKDMEGRGLIDLNVVFLLRDVRGWATSSSYIGKKMNKMGRPFIYIIYKWYLENKKYKKFLEKNNFKYIQISYENLVFDTENILKKIFNFSDLKINNFKLSDLQDSHITYGNRTKKGDRIIVYDARWMSQYWNNFSLILVPHIFFWNKNNVSLPKYSR